MKSKIFYLWFRRSLKYDVGTCTSKRHKSALFLSFLWSSAGIDHFALHLLALKLLAERQIRIHLQRLITSLPLPFWIRIHMMRSLQSCFGSEAPITFNKFSYKFGTQSSINHHFFHSEQSILERKSRKVFQSGKVVEKICSFNPRLVGPSMVVRQGGWIWMWSVVIKVCSGATHMFYLRTSPPKIY